MNIYQSLLYLVFGDENDKKIKILNSLNPSESKTLYTYLDSHNLIPIFFSKINQFINHANIPTKVLEQLQYQYLKFSSIYLKRSIEIKNILQKLNGDKVDVILLKGAYLAEKVYKNSTERVMCDIDILLREEEIERGINSLYEMGYKPISKFCFESLKANDIRHIPPFQKGDFIVEPHFSITSPSRYITPKIDMKGIWKRSIPFNYHGINCLAMNNEDLLLHLCLHIAGDKFKQKILHFYDIKLVVEQLDINWDIFRARVVKWNISKAVYCILYALNNIFYCKIQSDILDSFCFNFTPPGNLKEILEKKIFFLPTEKKKEKVVLEAFTSRDIKTKIDYFLFTLFSKKNITSKYGIKPNSKLYLYYVIHRFFILTKKYLTTFVIFYLFNTKQRKQMLKKEEKNLEFEKWMQA